MQYTNRSIRLHSKCLAILEMIREVNKRISEENDKLKFFNQCSDPYSFTRLFNTENAFLSRIHWHKSVKDRLINYYYNTMSAIIGEVAQRSFDNQLQTH